MPRACSVCSDTRRGQINARLVEGHTLRDVAKQFRLALASLHRHATRHLGRQLAEVGPDGGGTLLERVAALSRESARLGRKAERAGDVRTALAAVREMTRLAELVGRLTGELREGGTTVAVGVAIGTEVDASLEITRADWLKALELEALQAAVAYGRDFRLEVTSAGVEWTPFRPERELPPPLLAGPEPGAPDSGEEAS